MIDFDKMHKLLDSIDNVESNSLSDKILIVDLLNLFMRCFSVNTYTNDDGLHVGGFVGVLKSLGSVVTQINPKKVIIAVDGLRSKERRRKIYSEYKGQRNENLRLQDKNYYTAEEARTGKNMQIRRLSNYLTCLPVNMCMIDDLEADDVIYLLCNKLQGEKIVILSTDQDFYQLVNENISIYSPIKKIIIAPDTLKEQFGINNHNFHIYKSIIGDDSDNIDGLKGLGLKKLQKQLPILFNDEEISIDKIYDYCNTVSNFTTEKILKEKDKLERNLKLISFRYQEYDKYSTMLIEQEIENKPYDFNMPAILKYILEDKINIFFKEPIPYFHKTWARLDNESK